MEELPPLYQKTGQPVILGGSMETGSYLLVGVKTGAQTFFSTAHGSGRTMSVGRPESSSMARISCTRWNARHLCAHASYAGLAEEAGPAYKNIDDVVIATELAGISKRVARFVPIANIKG